jgi:hypothetical protein
MEGSHTCTSKTILVEQNQPTDPQSREEDISFFENGRRVRARAGFEKRAKGQKEQHPGFQRGPPP